MKIKTVKKSILLFTVTLLLCSCKSAQLVSNWKDPDTVLFHAYKVLIVGMTENVTLREDFETKMRGEFVKRKVDAVRSIDLFDVAFTTSEKSEKQLNEVEQQLLDKDFDAILFTKVIGSDNKKSLRSRLAETSRLFNSFSDDYLNNQRIFYADSPHDNYTVFNAETALYCICVGKERETIWRAGIDITATENFDKTIDSYIKLVVNAMEKQDLIFYTMD